MARPARHTLVQLPSGSQTQASALMLLPHGQPAEQNSTVISGLPFKMI